MNASSIIHLYDESVSPCGYCKENDIRTGESISYGFTADVINVTDYERLMLCGWRRSGNYFYKPNMSKTCCPAYAIRLHARSFRPSKSQRKVLRRMNNFLFADRQPDEMVVDVNELIPDNSDLSIVMTRPSFSQEKLNLYRKYQINIHGDKPEDITEESYSRFLVESPLVDDVTPSESSSIDNAQAKYGTFHQEYRLHDLLIAVGVIDILPTGLSSVYLFYDSDFNSLTIGKYTALREIDYSVQNELEYYYMGYYIHSCPKMRYKGEFMPSELMCPTTMQWYNIEACIPYLDRNKFTPLNPDLALERLSIPESAVTALEAYNPRFLPPPPENYYLNTQIIINSASSRRVQVGNLTEEGQRIIKRILDKFVARCGYENFLRFVFTFN
jgi:arginyl-tRNA---protein transferase